MNDEKSELVSSLDKAMEEVSQVQTNIEINNIVKKLLIKFTDSEYATLLIYNKEEVSLNSEVDGLKNNISMLNPKGLLGEVFSGKKAAINNHIASDKNYDNTIDNPRGIRLKSQLLVPIVLNDDLMGIARISRSIKYPKNFTNNDLNLIKSLFSFLIKIINILNGTDNAIDEKIDFKSDAKEINKKIKKVESVKQDNKEINPTMLFLSNTVHDIRTPANSLYGFLELIEEQIEDKRLKGFIENAKQSAQFINTLTDSILDRVKYQHESNESKSLTINSINFFSQVADIFSANMLKKDIDFLIYIDPNIPKEIYTIELKLKRILINLIGNAYKFTPKGGHIYFNVIYDEENKKIKLEIKDDGIGIDKDRQKDIFKAFQQAEADTTIHFGGTGLGLSICAKYVNELNSSLELDSAIDAGSKFYFDIPVNVDKIIPSHEKLNDKISKITILTDNKKSPNVENIVKYLLAFGVVKENIFITSELVEITEFIFCFQHKLDIKILGVTESKNVNLIIVEEMLFSLSNNTDYLNSVILSENTYYGDLIYNVMSSKKILKILIADDNEINALLLQAILAGEYCEIVIANNGDDTLKELKKAYIGKHPFQIVFLDEHMPGRTGSEVLEEFRVQEKKNNQEPIYAVSTTGDPSLEDEKKEIYDMFLIKPFKKKEIYQVLKTVSK